MMSGLQTFAARLRDFIASSRGPGAVLPGARNEASDHEFNTLALELFSLQFLNNPAYRRVCEARGVTPGSVECWSRIPAVPAAAFRDVALTSLPVEARTTVFRSSGTTGQTPSRHYHSAESLELYQSSLWSWFARNVLADLMGRPAGWQLGILTPAPTAAPHSSLAYMLETVRLRCGAPETAGFGDVDSKGAWTVDLDRIEAMLETADGPVLLLGTAFNFVHLLDGLTSKQKQFALPAGSRVVETGGYKGRSRELSKPALHALIDDRLGVPKSHIITEYGMCELSSQAYDLVAGADLNPQPSTRSFHFPPWCRVRIVSPETGLEVEQGASGILRVFDLANVWSVMAVQTEDIAVRCGDGFELIGRAVSAEPRGCSLMAT